MDHPNKFLDIVFHENIGGAEDLALCAGFERGEWRNEQLADHVIEWLPEFALTHSEINEIGAHNAVKLVKKAAKIVYQTEKYGSRGEFGEVFLHIAIRQIYKTIPAITKVYYKSAVNETVKGFDAVHVISGVGGLELWIGETKFYQDLNKAIYDVCIEIVNHLETDYLRNEFILIKNKIDPFWSESATLKGLLDDSVSLDTIFNKACIPILLTYESDVVKSCSEANDEYKEKIKKEISKAYESLRDKLNAQYQSRFNSHLPVTIHVILMPLKDKIKLIAALDKKLKALQV
jgi:hypothetical protein